MEIQIGPLHVRRSILIQAPPARVWHEFTSFERIAAWLDRGHKLHLFEPKLGGRADLCAEIDGERQNFGGHVLVWEPERELTLEINWRSPALAWPVPMLWTIRLTPIYDGTQVEIFHHGFERLGADAADNLQGYEDGWDIKHLKALRELVER